MPKDPVVLGGQEFRTYAYLTLRYCENGTVLDLLMKANSQGRKISRSA
jgi:hypothetical protein